MPSLTSTNWVLPGPVGMNTLFLNRKTILFESFALHDEHHKKLSKRFNITFCDK